MILSQQGKGYTEVVL